MMDECPLLDHDYAAVRNPMSRNLNLSDGRTELPALCVMSFMGDVIDDYVTRHNCMPIAHQHSETRDCSVFLATVNGVELCLVHAPVGAPAAGILMDMLIASGVRTIVSCGGCGVLEPIAAGQILIVEKSVRDEGTSFHYSEPGRFAETDKELTAMAARVLESAGVRHSVCTAWSTDGFFRETADIVAQRKAEGCTMVDMEASALAAVATHYGARYTALCYSGDSLADPEKHDERDWLSNTGARTIVFTAAIATLVADSCRGDASFNMTSLFA